MPVTIKLTVSDEVNAQMELMCKLNATNKYEWISGLIRDEIALFSENRKVKELQEKLHQSQSSLRKNWALDEVKNDHLITIGISYVVPPAY